MDASLSFPVTFRESRLKGSREITITPAHVNCVEKGLLRASTSWEEPLSAYTGVQLRRKNVIRGTSKHQRNELVFSVLLVHSDDRKTVTAAMYRQSEAFGFMSTKGHALARNKAEALAIALKLPIVILDEQGKPVFRKPEDLNKNIKTLVSEGKISIVPAGQYTGSRFNVRETAGSTEVTYSTYARTFLIFIILTSIISIPVYLFIPSGARPIAFVTAWMWFMIPFWGGFRQTLVMDRRGITAKQTRFFGLLPSTTNILQENIEEVYAGKDESLRGAGALFIASDEAIIAFGQGAKAEELDWMKRKVMECFKA